MATRSSTGFIRKIAVEVDEEGAREVRRLVCVKCTATVEVPPHVAQHQLVKVIPHECFVHHDAG
jgi:hypothetical protein